MRVPCFLSACLVLALNITSVDRSEAAILVDFEELALAPNSFFDGYGASATVGSWTSQGLEFQTTPFSPGWSYSNVNAPNTPGFMNQWAAITGTGFNQSANYALATSFPPMQAFINLPAGVRLESVMVTNATYSFYSMRDGDAFAKKFGGQEGNDPDYLKVIFTGFANFDATGIATGSAEFFLADYRFSNNALDYIVNQWTQLNLTTLGDARSIGVLFEGSDNGNFGLNTPAYVAIDNLQFTAVPEPTSFGLVITAWMTASFRRRQRNKSDR